MDLFAPPIDVRVQATCVAGKCRNRYIRRFTVCAGNFKVAQAHFAQRLFSPAIGFSPTCRIRGRRRRQVSRTGLHRHLVILFGDPVDRDVLVITGGEGQREENERERAGTPRTRESAEAPYWSPVSGRPRWVLADQTAQG